MAGDPTDMAAQARGMMEAREIREPSIDAAFQLRRSLEEKAEAEHALLSSDSLVDLPRLSRLYVEAAKRSQAAESVVSAEAGLEEPAINHLAPRSIVARG